MHGISQCYIVARCMLNVRRMNANNPAALIAESDRLRALAVRTTSADHARALHDRADELVRMADRTDRRCVVTAPAFYRVTIVTIVDRPDLRNATYAAVEPGSKVVARRDTWSRGEALALFDDAVRGAWDFGSEYVAAVEVWRMRDGRSPRTVRRRVERTR